MITLSLATALLCFAPSDCVPVLVGKKTPTGVFAMQQYRTDKPGFGGDVVVFDETPKLAFALHRVWTLKPQEKRVERLRGGTAGRLNVTNGCVNLLPEHYDRLVATLGADKALVVTR